MKAVKILLALLLVSTLAAACQPIGGSEPLTPIVPEPSATAAPTATATPVPSPTATAVSRTATPVPPTPTATPTPLPPTATATQIPPTATQVKPPFAITGLRAAWTGEKWEYRDPETNTVVGYWDGSRYTHIVPYLKAQWQELFVPRDPVSVEKTIGEALAKGLVKLPLPGVCDAKEVRVSSVYVHVAVNCGNTPSFLAPVSGKVTVTPFTTRADSPFLVVGITIQGRRFDVGVPRTLKDPQPVEVTQQAAVKAGEVVVRFVSAEAELPADWFAGKGWQASMTVLDNTTAFNELLLKDTSGRFVYTAPIGK